jgi:hypothetical protein
MIAGIQQQASARKSWTGHSGRATRIRCRKANADATEHNPYDLEAILVT